MATDSHLDLETRYCRGVKLNTLRHKAGYATPFPNPSTVPRKILGTTEHSRNAAGAGLGPYRSIIIELLGEERAAQLLYQTSNIGDVLELEPYLGNSHRICGKWPTKSCCG